MRIFIKSLGGAACLALTLTSGASAQDIRWNMQSAFNGNWPALGDSGVYFAEKIGEATDGRISIRFTEPGRLVPPGQIFDAVSSGSLDAGYAWSGYWIGKMPAVGMFASVPFGPETPEYLSWLYNGGGLELWQELYARHNVVPIPCGIQPPESSGWFRNEITKVEDLNGLKVRYSGIAGEVMRKLGASVTLLAGGDIFPNLERGVIDGAEFSTPAVDVLMGFHTIVKNNYYPGWHQPSSILEVLVNKDRWEALPAADRTLVELTCHSAMMFGMTKGIADQAAALETFRANGVEIREWPEDMMDAFRSASAEVMEEQAAADEDFRRVWESLKQFREKVGPSLELSRP
jgi:TRAP-type mannitol/chloroaromatic compound transport system substrate-binding protein